MERRGSPTVGKARNDALGLFRDRQGSGRRLGKAAGVGGRWLADTVPALTRPAELPTLLKCHCKDTPRFPPVNAPYYTPACGFLAWPRRAQPVASNHGDGAEKKLSSI